MPAVRPRVVGCCLKKILKNCPAPQDPSFCRRGLKFGSKVETR